MHPLAARAFLMTHLSHDGLKKFRVYERSAMIKTPNRYLQGFEIVRCMKSPPPNPTPEEVARMESLLKDYEWRKRKSNEEFTATHPEALEKEELDKIYEWEDYAIRNHGLWIGENTKNFSQPQYVPSMRERADLA
jgi:hypothetical protein